MPEKFKLKYLEICENEDLVYEFIDNWNVFLSQNILAAKEYKLKKIEPIKMKDLKLYYALKEDIDGELY